MIKFRPHHFLCTLGFQGKGYSPGFVKNYQKISDRLKREDGDKEMITVTYQTDDVCMPCPHRRGTLCQNEAKIEQLDQAHAAILDLTENDTLTWGEAKTKIKTQMTLAQFNQACAPCEWKKLGVCEAALKELLDSDDCCAVSERRPLSLSRVPYKQQIAGHKGK